MTLRILHRQAAIRVHEYEKYHRLLVVQEVNPLENNCTSRDIVYTLYSGHMVYTFYIHILYYLVQFDSKRILFRGKFHAVFIKIT